MTTPVSRGYIYHVWMISYMLLPSYRLVARIRGFLFFLTLWSCQRSFFLSAFTTVPGAPPKMRPELERMLVSCTMWCSCVVILAFILLSYLALRAGRLEQER